MAGALQSRCCECMRSPSGGNEGRRNCENLALGRLPRADVASRAGRGRDSAGQYGMEHPVSRLISRTCALVQSGGSVWLRSRFGIPKNPNRPRFCWGKRDPKWDSDGPKRTLGDRNGWQYGWQYFRMSGEGRRPVGRPADWTDSPPRLPPEATIPAGCSPRIGPGLLVLWCRLGQLVGRRHAHAAIGGAPVDAL